MVMADGLIVTDAGDVGPDATGHIVAIAEADGRVQWRFAVPSGVFGQLTTDGDGFFALSQDRVLYAITAGGEERWHVEIAGADVLFPVAGDERIYLVSSPPIGQTTDPVMNGDAMLAIDARDGTELWEIPLEEAMFDEPVVVEGMLLVTYTPREGETTLIVYSSAPR
jgi:outer membrane protein assembly factor BamB